MRAVESLMMVLALAVVGVGLWAVHKWLPQSGLSIFRSAGSETNTVAGPRADEKGYFSQAYPPRAQFRHSARSY